jgi:hypothetical protein
MLSGALASFPCLCPLENVFFLEGSDLRKLFTVGSMARFSVNSAESNVI